VPSLLIQQLLNILQKANVQAVQVAKGASDDRSLLVSLLFANGATWDGSPLPPPSGDYWEYLVYCTTPGGETAALTRAQFEVIMEFWPKEQADHLERAEDVVPTGTVPLGCCTDIHGKQTPNTKATDCAVPPNQAFQQNDPCSRFGSGKEPVSADARPAVG